MIRSPSWRLVCKSPLSIANGRRQHSVEWRDTHTMPPHESLAKPTKHSCPICRRVSNRCTITPPPGASSLTIALYRIELSTSRIQCAPSSIPYAYTRPRRVDAERIQLESELLYHMPKRRELWYTSPGASSVSSLFDPRDSSKRSHAASDA